MANQATITVELRSKSQEFERKFTKATETVKKGTEKVSKATKKAGTAAGQFQDKFRRASQSIAAIQGPLGPVAGRLTSLGTIIGNIGLKAAGVTLAIAAVAFGLGKMVSAGAKAERQFKRLEGILKATGGAAGLSLLEIESLSQEIGIQTLASTQEIRDAAGVLLTFKSITGDTFREALRLSQDLAEIGFGSAKSAAMQLGKALEEPEIGLSALRRVGVSFTEDQKERLRHRLASKLTTENQLVLSYDQSRSQHKNKEEVFKNLVQLLEKALVKPKKRKKTRPTLASKKRRLDSKKRNAQKKANRKPPDF